MSQVCIWGLPAFGGVACSCNALIFLWAGNFLIPYSSLRASPLVISPLVATSSTGRRDFVYLAPLPALCVATRLSTSVLIPQYRELSEQRSRYTVQLFVLMYPGHLELNLTETKTPYLNMRNGVVDFKWQLPRF